MSHDSHNLLCTCDTAFFLPCHVCFWLLGASCCESSRRRSASTPTARPTASSHLRQSLTILVSVSRHAQHHMCEWIYMATHACPCPCPKHGRVHARTHVWQNSKFELLEEDGLCAVGDRVCPGDIYVNKQSPINMSDAIGNPDALPDTVLHRPCHIHPCHAYIRTCVHMCPEMCAGAFVMHARCAHTHMCVP